MKKLLTKLFILGSMFVALTACGGGGGQPSSSSSDSSSSGSSTSQSQNSGQSEPKGDLPVGTDVTVYLVLTKVGKYEGKSGEKVPELFLENTIKLEAKVGDALPGKDKVTATSGATFQGWMAYEGNGAPTKYDVVPGYEDYILYANFSDGQGTSDPGDSGSSEQGGSGDASKPTSGFAIVVVRGSSTLYFAANDNGENYGKKEYVAKGVQVKSGDLIKCYDASSDTTWAIKALNNASIQGFASSNDGITCSSDANVDIYIQLKMNDDTIYIGAHS